MATTTTKASVLSRLLQIPGENRQPSEKNRHCAMSSRDHTPVDPYWLLQRAASTWPCLLIGSRCTSGSRRERRDNDGRLYAFFSNKVRPFLISLFSTRFVCHRKAVWIDRALSIGYTNYGIRCFHSIGPTDEDGHQSYLGHP